MSVTFNPVKGGAQDLVKEKGALKADPSREESDKVGLVGIHMMKELSLYAPQQAPLSDRQYNPKKFFKAFGVTDFTHLDHDFVEKMYEIMEKTIIDDHFSLNDLLCLEIFKNLQKLEGINKEISGYLVEFKKRFSSCVLFLLRLDCYGGRPHQKIASEIYGENNLTIDKVLGFFREIRALIASQGLKKEQHLAMDRVENVLLLIYKLLLSDGGLKIFCDGAMDRFPGSKVMIPKSQGDLSLVLINLIAYTEMSYQFFFTNEFILSLLKELKGIYLHYLKNQSLPDTQKFFTSMLEYTRENSIMSRALEKQTSVDLREKEGVYLHESGIKFELLSSLELIFCNALVTHLKTSVIEILEPSKISSLLISNRVFTAFNYLYDHAGTLFSLNLGVKEHEEVLEKECHRCFSRFKEILSRFEKMRSEVGSVVCVESIAFQEIYPSLVALRDRVFQGYKDIFPTGEVSCSLTEFVEQTQWICVLLYLINDLETILESKDQEDDDMILKIYFQFVSSHSFRAFEPEQISSEDDVEIGEERPNEHVRDEILIDAPRADEEIRVEVEQDQPCVDLPKSEPLVIPEEVADSLKRETRALRKEVKGKKERQKKPVAPIHRERQPFFTPEEALAFKELRYKDTKEVIKFLIKTKRLSIDRIAGSHFIIKDEQRPDVATVVPLHKGPLKPGTFQNIFRTLNE